MNDEKYESEIDLKQLLNTFLFSWRKIIVVAIIFTIFCGGYKFTSGIRVLNDKLTIANQASTYQTALSAYNTTKETLENEIINLKTSSEHQKEYNDNSILMQINPFDEQIASLNYYVDTNYQIIPNITYQNQDITGMVIRAYVASLQNGKLYTFIINNLTSDIELGYLKEIIYLNPDYENNTIYAQVVHYDKTVCEEIFVLLKQYFEQEKDNINDIVGDHAISIINESFQTLVDFDLEKSQNTNILTLNNYKISLAEKQNALVTLIEPTQYVTTKSSIIKSAIKYAIAGFILGSFLALVVIATVFLMSDRLLGTKELRSRYNLRVLGIMERSSKKRLFGFIDQFINKLVGISNVKIEEKEAVKRICANLKAFLTMENISNCNIMLTGTTDIKNIEALYNKISSELMISAGKLMFGGNISYTAETINKVADCNAIVIVEEIGQSTYTEITKEIENIKDLNKKVIGIIII